MTPYFLCPRSIMALARITSFLLMGPMLMEDTGICKKRKEGVHVACVGVTRGELGSVEQVDGREEQECGGTQSSYSSAAAAVNQWPLPQCPAYLHVWRAQELQQRLQGAQGGGLHAHALTCSTQTPDDKSSGVNTCAAALPAACAALHPTPPSKTCRATCNTGSNDTHRSCRQS